MCLYRKLFLIYSQAVLQTSRKRYFNLLQPEKAGSGKFRSLFQVLLFKNIFDNAVGNRSRSAENVNRSRVLVENKVLYLVNRAARMCEQ